MTEGVLPCRSVLYVPGSRRRAMEKAAGLPVDAVILDLEDAVAPAEKPAARDAVVATLAEVDFGPRRRIVRINGLGTPWGRDDLRAVAPAAPDAVLVPKVDGPELIVAVGRYLERFGAPCETAIWAMIETPAGVLNAGAIATAPRLAGFVAGTNDLARDLGALPAPDRAPLLPSLGLMLLAARAAGIVCVDGVYNAFRDAEGLAAECRQGRMMGFDGKTLIHPDQVAAANAAFGPTEAEVAEARATLAAFEDACARGEGVAVLNGRIVENLHADAARRVLARAEAIAALG